MIALVLHDEYSSWTLATEIPAATGLVRPTKSQDTTIDIVIPW